MNQDELDCLNDQTLEENERHWRDIDDDEPKSDEDNEGANIAEDNMMDERDGWND